LAAGAASGFGQVGALADTLAPAAPSLLATTGAGAGDGEVGDSLGGDGDEEGEGGKKAGKDAGEHRLEMEVSRDALDGGGAVSA